MRAGRGARGMLVRVGRSWYASPMSRLSGEITKALQPGMVVPAPLEQLFTWMETNGRVRDHGDGRLVGCLHSAEEHRTGWTDTERRGGTLIEFAAHADEALDNWFGNSDPAVLNRLSVFARTGGDGSRAAFWLAPDGVSSCIRTSPSRAGCGRHSRPRSRRPRSKWCGIPPAWTTTIPRTRSGRGSARAGARGAALAT